MLLLTIHFSTSLHHSGQSIVLDASVFRISDFYKCLGGETILIYKVQWNGGKSKQRAFDHGNKISLIYGGKDIRPRSSDDDAEMFRLLYASFHIFFSYSSYQLSSDAKLNGSKRTKPRVTHWVRNSSHIIPFCCQVAGDSLPCISKSYIQFFYKKIEVNYTFNLIFLFDFS